MGNIRTPVGATSHAVGVPTLSRAGRDPHLDSELDPLLERSRRGDSVAWSLLVARLQGLVYAIPPRYGLGGDDADDVFLATFEALHRNLDRVGGGRVLPSYVATVATRESLRIQRLTSRAAEVPLDELLAADDRDAEAEAVRADEAYRVRSALARMAPGCRTLLQALYAEDEAAYADVSARLGLPMGTIGPTRARCLEKLRRMLEKEGFFG